MGATSRQPLSRDTDTGEMRAVLVDQKSVFWQFLRHLPLKVSGKWINGEKVLEAACRAMEESGGGKRWVRGLKAVRR